MTTEDERSTPAAVFGAMQASGFPLQTAVAHAAKTAEGWTLLDTEYPWRDSEGRDQFLDIVITNERWFVTIECKKTTKETFNFLRPVGLRHSGLISDFRCLHGVQIIDSSMRIENFCSTLHLSPRSHDSEFCIVSTSDSGKNQRLLERDAQLLIRATDEFARDHQAAFNGKTDPAPPEDLLYIPILVTNAPIYASRYRPTDVSLETGQFDAPPAEIEEVRWVRFRKAFGSAGGIDLGERSIFVVRADALVEFLGQLALDGAFEPDKSGHLQKRPRR